MRSDGVGRSNSYSSAGAWEQIPSGKVGVGTGLGVKPGGKLVGVKVAVKVAVYVVFGEGVAVNSEFPAGASDCGTNIGAQLARRINTKNKQNILFVFIATHQLLQFCGLAEKVEKFEVMFPPLSGYSDD